MYPDVDALVREERLLEAAKLLGERGESRAASLLYERACDWASAARESLRAGDATRALDLAIEAGDEDLADAAATRVESEPGQAALAAGRLAARGRDRWAARLLEASGDPREAARAWERAGGALRSAKLLEGTGDASGAARVLEAALRRDPQAWSAAVALGALLLRFGKHEAATRTLQRVPGDAPERRDALCLLVPALERLGLGRAAGEAAAELAALGGVPRPEQAPPQGPAPTRLFGRYELVREIASSPNARVLECVDVVRAERVAVKVFAGWDARGSGRDALLRFEREVRTLRALDHPNVVPLREFVPEGPAIVLAWMGGGTLERLVTTAGPLAPSRAVEIAVAVLSALGDAHRLGILHRDVKPANVLFDDAGVARLSDFGVAHLGDVSATATAGVFGTLAYMSPEQREGRPAGVASDLYSVGIVLREMLTGERATASRRTPRRPSEAHRELGAAHDAVVARLDAPSPADRPADAFEARSSLLALTWPATCDPTALPRVVRRSSVRPEGQRVAPPGPDGAEVDTWTEREIVRVPLTAKTLERARAFARADHPGLQAVLRVDREAASIWLEARRGRAPGGGLTREDRALLDAGLEALHAAGGIHGHVDAEHVVIDERGVVLLFEGDAGPMATIDRDRLALTRL